MRITNTFTIEDPSGRFRRMLRPEMPPDGRIKNARIVLSGDEEQTQVDIRAEDASSMRTAIAAVMNALRVHDRMNEVHQDGHTA